MRYTFAAIIVAVMLTVSASASTVSYWGTPNPYGPSTYPFPSGASLAFQQWNPADYVGYTLTGIDLYLEGTLSGTQGYHLDSGTGINVTVETESTMTLQLSGSDLVVTIPDQVDSWSNVNSPSSDSVSLNQSANNTAAVASTYWASFTGGGTVALDLLGTVNNYYSGSGGQGGGDFDSKGSARGEVTYTYEPNDIPEPGTLALLGFGLVGLLALRRRKKS